MVKKQLCDAGNEFVAFGYVFATTTVIKNAAACRHAGPSIRTGKGAIYNKCTEKSTKTNYQTKDRRETGMPRNQLLVNAFVPLRVMSAFWVPLRRMLRRLGRPKNARNEKGEKNKGKRHERKK